jgi:hypothetical protein
MTSNLPARLSPDEQRRLERVRRIATLLDNALPIPGTSYRIGLDPILGLHPGLGDAVGAVMAGYILVESARLGAPRSVLVRMLLNIGIDSAVGAVPGLGDLFDFVWKADAKNFSLLERHLDQPLPTRRASRGVLVGVAVAIGLLALGAVALVVLLAQLVSHLLG